MAVSPTYLGYVLDQLRGITALRSRRMFGGIGLYAGDAFFGLIDDDVLYFKVDDTNRNQYLSRGCEPFHPFGDETVSMGYYRVPDDLLEDPDEAIRWARASVGVAMSKAAAKKKKKNG